jgi:hypothetical protein
MKTENQKLVGYIIYEIYAFSHEFRGEKGVTVVSPEVSWKKKIYTTITAAEEALAHIEKHDWRSGVIVPIYANLEDLDKVSEKFKEIMEEKNN